jgi:uncharacterized protein
MTGTSNRGFASMDSAKQREIASKGGKAAHQKGTAHQFTSEEARRAGSKGGRAARHKRAQQMQPGGPKTPHLVLRKEGDEPSRVESPTLSEFHTNTARDTEEDKVSNA